MKIASSAANSAEREESEDEKKRKNLVEFAMPSLSLFIPSPFSHSFSIKKRTVKPAEEARVES